MPPELLIRLPDTYNVYLVRHATPDRSQTNIPYYILPGPALSEAGKQEALGLGQFLNVARVTSITASPFERTRMTMEIAGVIAGAASLVDPDLGERQPNEMEAHVVERMLRSFEAAAHNSYQVNGPVALVSHGLPVMVLLKALGMPGGVAERCRIYDNRNLIPMAGVWQVERANRMLSMRLGYVPKGTRLPYLTDVFVEEKGSETLPEAENNPDATVPETPGT